MDGFLGGPILPTLHLLDLHIRNCCGLLGEADFEVEEAAAGRCLGVFKTIRSVRSFQIWVAAMLRHLLLVRDLRFLRIAIMWFILYGNI